MGKHRVSIAILAGIICVAMIGIASGQGTLSFYLENDGTIIKPLYKTDRHYTNGTKIVFKIGRAHV